MHSFDLNRLLAQAGTPELPLLPIPEGDLHLADGRWLRAQGLVAPDVVARGGEPTMQASYWRGPQHLIVIASSDLLPAIGRLLHVSISYPDRDPSWADIRAVRDVFYPDTLDVMMILPRVGNYVNLHPHAFHLQQMPVGWASR